MSIVTRIKDKYANYRLTKVNKLENSVKEIGGSVTASISSPDKLMPDKLKITLKTLPRQLSIAKNMELTVKSLKNNPENPKVEAKTDFIEQFENYAKSIGINNIGYVKVPSTLIFKNKSILFHNAIILMMEMDKKAVDAAPSPETQEMSNVTYDELGKKTNKLAKFLRENGFAAHASHPAGGVVMYPHLAQKAGLGHKGTHGMLITPEFGPRQRLSAVFTSIQNLPAKEHNEHSWIPDFCAKCGKCIKNCPGSAIIKEKCSEIIKTRTKIVKDLCSGCTICMRECSFNRRAYTQIKDKFEKSKQIIN
ncbi:epoxyqueuosine reductase [Methanobacterium sp.]|uniref:epoxyqueuosine reductase n=1 Tax=Methanobacterium sp. TaxID=2164 RepID=UPI003C75C5E5